MENSINSLLSFGLINIDKPEGPTSFSVSEFVKKKLNLKKTSHMGTLDPKVTGVLPITLGRACKLSDYFIKHDKTYVGILETHKEQDIKKLQKIIDEKFTGKIKQTPPHRSAVKRAQRIRAVYHWKLLEESENKKSFLFEAKVQGGTYIRKLCSDLGEIIGGAHMGELRRTQAGIFDESNLATLYELEKAVEELERGNENPLRKMITPAEDAIKKVLPAIQIKKEAIESLYVGKPLLKEHIIEKNKIKNEEIFAVFSGKEFIGTYKKIKHATIFAKPEFVFN